MWTVNTGDSKSVYQVFHLQAGRLGTDRFAWMLTTVWSRQFRKQWRTIERINWKNKYKQPIKTVAECDVPWKCTHYSTSKICKYICEILQFQFHYCLYVFFLTLIRTMDSKVTLALKCPVVKRYFIQLKAVRRGSGPIPDCSENCIACMAPQQRYQLYCASL